MEYSYHPKLALTLLEVQRIQEWISQNGYSLDSGHFKLIYDFWVLGVDIRIQWNPDNGADNSWLEIRESSADKIDNMTDHVEIAGRVLSLVLPETLSKQWLCHVAKRTEAEVNASCEPSGSSLHITIQRHAAQVLIGSEQMTF